MTQIQMYADIIDGMACFYDDESPNRPSTAVKISYERYQEILYGMNMLGKVVYFDDDGIPQLKDRVYTPEELHKQFIQSATNLYNASYQYTNPYEWHKLTIAQQGELTIYLDTLDGIINGADIEELPTKPIFIKG